MCLPPVNTSITTSFLPTPIPTQNHCASCRTRHLLILEAASFSESVISRGTALKGGMKTSHVDFKSARVHAVWTHDPKETSCFLMAETPALPPPWAYTARGHHEPASTPTPQSQSAAPWETNHCSHAAQPAAHCHRSPGTRARARAWRRERARHEERLHVHTPWGRGRGVPSHLTATRLRGRAS